MSLTTPLTLLTPLAVGLGCDRGTPLATVEQALAGALAVAGFDRRQVAVLATISAKANEAAFIELARFNGWPLRLFSAEELSRVAVPNPSEIVRRYMGTPSVSEAAAVLAGGSGIAALLVEKYKLRGRDGRHATVSLSRFER